jgi:glycosyltransferase involved in cell wall biosynthesis
MTGGEPDVLVMLPVYNDWVAFGMLLTDLDSVLAAAGRKARVLAVDDGSAARPESEPWGGRPFRALRQVEVLELRRNLGHQRAIAVGLAYAEACDPCDAVVVMDSDGEDDPRDVPRLLDRCEAEGGRLIVFAERSRRSESAAFRVGYAAYKAVHLALTGLRVRVGNFSVVPRARLSSLVVVSELWNHYAAAVFKSRQPFCMVPTRRATRYHGRSSMNYVSLVAHGLSAISVFADLVGVRLLVLTLPMIALTVLGMALTVYLRAATPLAIPGWATTAVGVLAILLFQGVMFAMVFIFMVLGGRSGSNFLPLRDYPPFILRKTPLGEASWASRITTSGPS